MKVGHYFRLRHTSCADHDAKLVGTKEDPVWLKFSGGHCSSHSTGSSMVLLSSSAAAKWSCNANAVSLLLPQLFLFQKTIPVTPLLGAPTSR